MVLNNSHGIDNTNWPNKLISTLVHFMVKSDLLLLFSGLGPNIAK